MKSKKLLISLLSVGIGLSSLGLSLNFNRNKGIDVRQASSATTETRNFASSQESSENSNCFLSFEDYIGYISKDLNSSEKESLKDLYKKAISAQEKATKELDTLNQTIQKIADDKNITWDSQYNDLFDYSQWNIDDNDINNIDENMDFNEFLDNIKNELGSKNYSQVKQLYDKIIKLESEEKYNEADSLWEKIDKILAPIIDSLPEYSNDEMVESTLIANYNVKNGDLILNTESNTEKISEKDMKNHEVLWNKVKKIIPKSYLYRISSFTIDTDGVGGIAASVGAMTDENKKFDFSIDLKDSFDEKGNLIGEELNHTIIHEFGHILTLNNSQMKENRDEKSKTYTTEEGTTIEKSYLNKFYNKFWKSIYKEWKKANENTTAENTEEMTEDAAYKFYEKHSDSFVTDYAATNPEEDIAESFTAFVLQDKPKGHSIKDKKVLFFYDFEEAVKLRNEIRQNIK